MWSATERFWAEYGKASSDLEAFYSRLQLWELQTLGGVTTEDRIEVAYYASGHSYRVDTRFLDRGGLETVAIVTPDLSFDLRRTTAEALFAIRRLRRPPDYDADLRSLRTTLELPFAPYCIFESRVADFVTEGQLRVTGDASVDRDGESLIQLSWASPFTDNSGIEHLQRGWFLFAPHDAWVLREFEIWVGDGSERMRQVIEYGEKVGAIPLPSRAERWYIEGERATLVLRAEALKVTTEPPCPDAFTLAAFGIPEGVAGSAPVGGRLRYWLVLLSILGLAVAGILAWLARRRERPQP